MKTILARLVSFKTTADQPEEIRKGFFYIASLFDKTKFRTEFFEKNGIYSMLISFCNQDARNSKFLLSGHFDIVPPQNENQYVMRLEENKAYGRGTFDMKGVDAVFITAMQKLGELENPPSCALLITGDEETNGENGTGYVVRECGLMPEFVLCGDGGGSDWEFSIKEKGILWVELSAKGKGAHSAYLWEGENAVEKVIAAVQKIQNFIGEVKPNAWKTTANLAYLETSNKTPNVVPSDACAALDIRFTEELAETPEELVRKLKQIVPEVSINVLSQIKPFVTDEQNPFVQHFKKIADTMLDQSVPLTFEHGCTDMRYFGEKGIPAIIFGALGAHSHADDEWVDIESLHKLRDILLQFLQNEHS